MKKEVVRMIMGIDVSKDKLDTCVMSVDPDNNQKIVSTRAFNNSPSDISALIEYWNKKSSHVANRFIIMEPTGIYHENLAYKAHSCGLNVCIELANKIAYFIKSLNIKTKTDKSDSIAIARYGARNDVKFWAPCSKNELNLKHLTRYRDSILRCLISAKNREHAYDIAHETDEYILDSIKDEIRFYEQQKIAVDKQIQDLIKSDKELSHKVNILMSIPGVGIITTATVIAETGGFQTFKSVRSLVSYAGLDVAHKESGTIAKQSRISKRGNCRLRKALFMPSLSVASKADTIAPVYDRICEEKKIKMKGVVAVMRKTLVLMYTLWKSEEMYDPNHKHPSLR